MLLFTLVSYAASKCLFSLIKTHISGDNVMSRSIDQSHPATDNFYANIIFKHVALRVKSLNVPNSVTINRT